MAAKTNFIDISGANDVIIENKVPKPMFSGQGIRGNWIEQWQNHRFQDGGQNGGQNKFYWYHRI